MKKTINKDIKKYCSEVKKLLACPGGIKFAFISELKNRIYEYIEEDYEPILYDDKYYSNHPNHVL